MRLIDAEPISKLIQDGLNSGKFGYDAIEILAEIQFAPTVEAFATEEIEAAVKDRDILCKTGHCISCEYENTGCFTPIHPSMISKLMRIYRKRKEAGK